MSANTAEEFDGPLDAGARDSGSNSLLDSAMPPPMDAALASACTSWTAPSANKCGGTHCLQDFGQLSASVLDGSVCGSQVNLETLCSLKGPKAVGTCSINYATDRPRIPVCAREALQDAVTEPCLDCYLKSADCGFENCLFECLAGTETERCDTCRLNAGCGDVFYECAGITPPPR